MKNILLILIIFCTLSGCDSTYEEIDADDNGAGKMIRNYVRMDDNDANVLSDSSGTKALKWADTGLMINSNTIGLSISGSWYPWGWDTNIESKDCTTTSCSSANDTRCKDVPPDTLIVENNTNNKNCNLSNGMGIYMLIAKKKDNGSYSDPNQNASTANAPSSRDGFFTAHLGEFKVNGGLINVNQMWACDYDANNKILCDAVSVSSLMGGRVYVKVVDSYYYDNDASRVDRQGNKYVGVNIKTGIYYPNFITAALGAFKNTTDIATKALRESMLASLQDVIRAVIFLYFVMTAFGFMTGLVKLTQAEAVVRLLKIGIVIMLTTPNNIITEGFLTLYGNLANAASNIIANALPNLPNQSNVTVSSGLEYLTVYDGILNQVISPQIHVKIWSLMRCLVRIWCIPLLYILIFIIIVIVLRSLLLYITAFIQINLLILILPILAVTLLFKTTADLFQNWLKYMANSALMIVVATLGMGLTISIMCKNLGSLLNYSVANTNWFLWLYWWEPDNSVVTVLTGAKYFSSLVIALICYAFVEHIPKFADALTEAQLAPTTNAFNALWRDISGAAKSGLQDIKSFNAKYGVGMILNQRYKTNGKYDETKEGKNILDKWKITRDKVNFFFYKNFESKYDSIKQSMNNESMWSSNNQEQAKLQKDYLEILQTENKYAGNTTSVYDKLIETKEKELNEKMKEVKATQDSVKATVDGKEIDFSFKDSDSDNNISIGQDKISKDDISKAMKDNGGIFTDKTTGKEYNFKSMYDKNLETQLNKHLENLNEMKNKIMKIKRQ